jgi:plastocyanin
MHISLIILLGTALLAPTLVIAKVVNVNAVEFMFVPKVVDIQAGDTVRWTVQSTNQHTVTHGTSCEADGLFTSGLLGHGQSFEHTFMKAGEYPYFCQIHCHIGMTGLVTVK